MRIVQLTPGTGTWYCGSCLRDNTLARELRVAGHEVVVVPMYLPLFTDEPDASGGGPVFFGGVNVYLQQKSALFRALPMWMDRVFDAAPILALAGRASGMTNAADLGDMTVSMLRGELGHQRKEIDRLVEWLATQPKPDVIVLANALLAGLARPLKARLGVKVACTLQGEDPFLDAHAEPFRTEAWEVLRERARDVDGFVSVSAWHADVMRNRLGLEPSRVHVVHNGISLEGWPVARPVDPPVLGYFARMCADKGLHLLVDAWLELRRRGVDVRLKIGGAVTAMDESFVAELRARIDAAGQGGASSWHPNVTLAAKHAFFEDLSVFSVPATYGESFGLFALEAMAAGVPVVAPRHGAFPELVEATGGGVLCTPDDPIALADAIGSLLADRSRAAALGAAGRESVFARFGSEHMAARIADAYARIAGTP